MAETTTLNENHAEQISALLTGRRITTAEVGRFDRPGHNWRTATGRLTLDDGTVILVAPNQGGCSCSAGDYDLTALAAVDNVITSVRVACETKPEDLDRYQSDQSYRIYVVADAVEINAVQIDGNDGNGYYGTGYELIVLPPNAAPADTEAGA